MNKNEENFYKNFFAMFAVILTPLVIFMIVFWCAMTSQQVIHLSLTSFFGMLFVILIGAGVLISQVGFLDDFRMNGVKDIILFPLAIIIFISFLTILFCGWTLNHKIDELRKAEKSIIKQETVIYSIQELEVEENYNSSTPRKIKVTYLDKNNHSQTVTIEGGEISNLNSYRGEKPKIQIDKRYISDEDVKKYNVDSFDVERINKTKYKIIQRTLFDK